MPFVVCKVPMEHVQDTAGIEAAMREWNFGADDIIAVVAKTEGNGGVNDISRILVDRVLRDFLVAKGSRTRAQALQVPIALSGGCDGVISPQPSSGAGCWRRRGVCCRPGPRTSRSRRAASIGATRDLRSGLPMWPASWPCRQMPDKRAGSRRAAWC